jgi:lysophospholipase L1-like esterase
MYFVADPHTGFRLAPNSKGHYRGDIPANANAHGHRDDFVPFARSGATRVLVLGDSFSVGAGVAQAQAYPQVLETLLRRSGLEIEIVNTAVGGWSPAQYASYFEAYGREFQPDVVLIGFFVGNDSFEAVNPASWHTAVMGRRVKSEDEPSVWLRAKVLLVEYSHLARLVLAKGSSDRAMNRDGCDDFTPAYLELQALRMRNHRVPDLAAREAAAKNVREIERIVRAAGESTPVVVALLPDENQLNPDLRDILVTDPREYDFEQPQKLLKQLFEDVELAAVVDLMPALESDASTSSCLYQNDSHWTPEGHALVAARLARYFGMSGLLGEASRR